MIEALSRVIATCSRAPFPRASAMAALGALAALGLAACGGNDAGGETAPADDQATVSLQDVPGYGDVLVTRSGDPLFVSSGDPRGESACTGKCARTWKPLTITGRPTAGPDVDAELLSTMERDDGATQVLYNERPLYTHPGKGLPVDTKEYGGTWYLVDQRGQPVTSTAPGGY